VIEIKRILEKTREKIIFIDEQGKKHVLYLENVFPWLIDPFNVPGDEFEKWEKIKEGTKIVVHLHETITRIHLAEC